MKTLSEDFITQDELPTRQPAEIYDFWEVGGEHYRYTSGDTAITFEGYEYKPAAIRRSGSSVNEAVSGSEITITLYYSMFPSIRFLIFSPISATHIRILKIFRDQDPYESEVIFIGVIKKPSFTGMTATITCSGFDYYLKVPIPRDRYQPSCNAFVYDERCQLNSDDYKTVVVPSSVDANGLYFGSSIFVADDPYYIWGFVDNGESKRMIVDVSDGIAYLRYPIDLTGGKPISVYPGCGGSIETCFDTFNNVNNFRGQSGVPLTNPVTLL